MKENHLKYQMHENVVGEVEEDLQEKVMVEEDKMHSLWSATNTTN